MLQTASDDVRSPLTETIGRMGRYLIVSLVNVVNHQLLLQLAVNVFGWSGGWANAFAAATAALPAYWMARRWVWSVDGRSSLRHEVLPFWGLALAGLVVSSATAEAADRAFESPLMISVGSIIGYTIVWIAKFVLLNRIFTGDRD